MNVGEKSPRVWVGKSEDETPLRIRRLDGRIILHREIVDCIHLAQNTDQQRAVVITLVVVQIPHSKRIFLATT